MANKIIQYRYYGDNNNNNSPREVQKNEFVSGEVFQNTSPILQLGIQTLPGARFYLNKGIDPVYIGPTGIYELDLENKTEIVSLRFDNKTMDLINKNNNAYLIVDILYESEEA